MKSLKEFETLDGELGARNHTCPAPILLTSNEVEGSFVIHGLHDYFTYGVGELFTFVRNVLARNGDFDFRNDSEDGQLYTAMLTALVDSEVDVTNKAKLETFKDSLLAQANPIIKPHENATLPQFNMANGIYTPKTIEEYPRNRDIIIALSESVEKCSATVWSKEEGFEWQNVGRSVLVGSADNKYRIDMSRTNTRGVIEVRIPLETDFSVSAE